MKTRLKCGSCRGFTECVSLNSCDGDISSHLRNHHLSRENVCEKDLILARAGLLELTEEQVKNMMVFQPIVLPWGSTGRPLRPASIQDIMARKQR